MIEYLKLWLDNRFPRKPLPMVGLLGLLSSEQKAKALHNKEPETNAKLRR